ncbi:WD repeat-containing protein 18 [Chytriomyces hyalinus]|nr:WD repeat-containing protein 18 [Chytriomyces hyalinus]
MSAQFQFAVCHPTETAFTVCAAVSSAGSAADAAPVATYRSSATAASSSTSTVATTPSLSAACAVSATAGFLIALPTKSIVLCWVWGKEASPACKLAVPEVLSALCFSNNSLWVVGGGVSGRVYMWEISTGNMVAMYDAHFKPIKTIAFSADDSAFVTAGDDAFAHTWLVARVTNALDPGVASQSYATMTGHSLPITDAAFSSTSLFNKSKLFTSSLDRSVKVWDATTGSNLVTILFPRALTCLAVDPLDMIVYAGAQDGIVYSANLFKAVDSNDTEDEGAGANVMGLSEGEMITLDDGGESIFKGHKGGITSLALSFDGKLLMSGSQDGSAILWDAPTRQQLRTHYLSPATAAAAAKSSPVPPVGRVLPVLRPRQTLMAVGGPSRSSGDAAMAAFPVWKRFPAVNRAEERGVDVVVKGGGVKPVIGGSALLDSWDDLDLSVPPFDEEDLSNYPNGYNTLLDTSEQVAMRFHQLSLGLEDEKQSELERLKAQVESLTEHNRALRALNDDLYEASSKQVVELLRDRKKARVTE